MYCYGRDGVDRALIRVVSDTKEWYNVKWVSN